MKCPDFLLLYPSPPLPPSPPRLFLPLIRNFHSPFSPSLSSSPPRYNTGVLFLPWGYDASQIGLALVYVLTAISGADLFLSCIPPFSSIYFPHACEFFFHASSFAMTVPMSLCNVYACWRRGEAKRANFYDANKPWIPLLSLFALTTAWVLGSPTDILSTQPR